MATPETVRDIPVARRLGRVLLIIGGTAAAVVLAVSNGAITLPWAQDSAQSAQTGSQASLAAARVAANQQWAAATCASILEWKNEIQRDGTSIDLGFDALARIQDAITATSHMLSKVNRLGLPPAADTPQVRAEIDQLRSDIESHVHNIEGAAGSVTSGNLAAIGTLLSDLATSTLMGPPIVKELRHVLSVDLGLSLVETRACRQLVGIPI